MAKSPAGEMRSTLDSLARISMGDGFEREGETQDSPPPSYVQSDANPELCKEALDILSRHLLTEIQALIKRDGRFSDVFDLPAEDL